LRKLGWETRKTNHALRAYSGSQVAIKYGIYDAQAWLRHSTVKVTEDSYSQYVKDFKPANLDDIPARWATLERPEPQLRVLPQPA
jgi:integrase